MRAVYVTFYIKSLPITAQETGHLGHLRIPQDLWPAVHERGLLVVCPGPVAHSVISSGVVHEGAFWCGGDGGDLGRVRL